MRERILPEGYTEAPDNFTLGYTIGVGRGSRYGLGHFTDDIPDVWKRVKIYNDKWTPVDAYWIHPSGRLYSGRLGRELKAYPALNSQSNRYPEYKVLCTDGRYHHMSAHRLVVDTFLTRICDQLFPIVNHRNGLKTDSVLTNLERTNPTLNIQHYREEIKPKQQVNI